MATFTIEFRAVIALIGEDNIGLNNYPIFDEGYRKTLNRRIIDHYWYNEIAHETIDIFVRQMRTKMNEIMPIFNDYYRSQLIDFDPMLTQYLSSDSTGTQNVTGTGTSTERGSETGSADTTSTSDARTVSSEMPQTRLAGSEDYATSATDSKASQTGHTGTTGSSEHTGTSGSTSDASSASRGVTKGYAGVSGSELVARYRDSVINVDLMVLDALSPLFMGIWNNGDTYTNGGYYGLY